MLDTFNFIVTATGFDEDLVISNICLCSNYRYPGLSLHCEALALFVITLS